MKLALFIFLLLLFLYSLLIHFNIQVSYKYEVDLVKTEIDIDHNLSIEQKKARLKEVSDLEKSLNIQSWVCAGVALLSFSGLVIMAILQAMKITYSDSDT